MPHQISGSAKAQVPTYKIKGEKLTKALVVEEIKIIEVPKTYIVPVIKTKVEEQVKYKTKVEEQVKYKTVEKPTVKYGVVEEQTTKFKVTEKETIKFVVKEVSVERPIPVDKPYERPRIVEKEYVIASIKDMENVRSLMDLVPKLVVELGELRKKMNELRDVKLVEKVIEVPRLQWITTPVERIVWKDVERNRPSADTH
ncbi:hypothetical protein LCGC14_0619830 [marine sediment metagenome]|uniref:Uncharacterized protein n=1 Tax=marine sediment metagenome TaxID=412755 RepID=A0A0F9TRF9_9ZZZZ